VRWRCFDWRSGIRSVGSKSIKEDCHAIPNSHYPPPRRNKSNGHPAARQLWGTVPAEHQERILGALIRVIALQLAKTPEVEGVTRDRS